MIVTLIGADQFSKDKRVEKFLTEALGNQVNDPMAKQILHATDTNIDSIADVVITSCESVSMFSPEQVIVVRNAEALKADDTKALAKWLSSGVDPKILFDFESLAASNELYKVFKKVATIEKFDEPKSYKMAEWIAQMVPSQFGKPIEPNACAYLAEAIGTDTKLVCEEVEKILLYKPDCAKITLDLVKIMVVPQRDIIAYEIQDPFGMQDVKAYTRKLNEMLNSGVNVVTIVSTLYNYALDLLKLQSLMAQGMSSKDAAAKMGKNEFLFCIKGKAPECARRWRKPILCRVLRRLADLDYEIKSGKCSTRIAQELALATLVVR
ncbi:MAG: DNA polymerase III subunit delta [Fibrobacteraceae bacterium]|nr:DNA polymerase III subunit delta [Fibrobacteraceae bacterium]